MSNKVTKKDRYNELLAIPAVAQNADLVAFIEHEVELLSRKSENRSTKPTVRQAENAEIKTAIVNALEKGKWYRCAEIKALVPALASGEGTQRTARLCNDLADKEVGALVKMVDKKVVYFGLAE